MAANSNENKPSSAHYETPNEYVKENTTDRTNNQSPLLTANKNKIRTGGRNEGMTVNFSKSQRKNRSNKVFKKAALSILLLFLVISNIYCIVKVNNIGTTSEGNNIKVKDLATQKILNETMEQLTFLNNSFQKFEDNLPLTIVGKLKWEFKNFTASQKEAQGSGEQMKVSDPFVTHNGLGYKLRIQLFPNGYDTGLRTHIGIVFEVLPGELDEYLPWPFNYRISVTLFNSSFKHRRSFHYNPLFTRCLEMLPHSQCGWATGITQKEIKHNGFLINDTLTILVIVRDI